jgi:hypothetical protein
VLFIIICAPDSLVHPRTEGNKCLPNKEETEREMCPWDISIIVLVIRCPTHCFEFICAN